MRTLDRKLSLFCLLGFMGSNLTACARQGEPENSHLGASRDVDAIPDEDVPSPPQEPTEEAEEEQNLVSLDELAERERRARQVERASKELSEIPSADNDLGLVLSLSQRAADVLWLLAIENRGSHDIRLAALPSLLTFEVLPPPAAGADETPGAVPPATITCGAPPSGLSPGETVVLQQGQLLTYEFDPREYCDDDSILTEGATVTATYGFPLLTKKVWRRGKLTTELVEQKPPYVAEQLEGETTDLEASSPLLQGAPPPASEPASETPPRQTDLRQLLARPFFLDETYPLEAVFAHPPSADEDAEKGAPDDPNAPGEPERGPLELTIQPMGTTSDPDAQLVTVRVRNVDQEPIRLFWRREHLTFQVVSERGTTTCYLQPSDRAPDANAFSYITPGSSRSYSTRLREACPKGTFDEPGTYFVSARMDANISGEEHGYDAFIGTTMTKTPARFVVRGGRIPPSTSLFRVSSRASVAIPAPPTSEPPSSEPPSSEPAQDDEAPVD